MRTVRLHPQCTSRRYCLRRDAQTDLYEETATLFSELLYARYMCSRFLNDGGFCHCTVTQFEFIRICYSTSLCYFFKTTTTWRGIPV